MTKKECRKHDQMYINLHRGISIYTDIIILMEGAAFIIVVVVSCILFPSHKLKFQFGYELKAVIPMILLLAMILLLGVAHMVALRIAYRRFMPLENGLKMIAEGNFTVRIQERKRNFLEPMYRDFNKMAEELGKTSILRNDFINDYSHEFKTPIASINGFANLLLRRTVSEAEQHQYLQIIANESKRLADLAEETLLLSRLDTQQIITGRTPYSLDEQLRTCVIMLSAGWDQKKLLFSGDLAEVTYTGNEELMQHLWLNLLSNAIKFTSAGGEITVSLVQENDEAVVTVADTGSGMDEETLHHLFERYYQGPAGKNQKGLGLGLSIVQRIIELCGGMITVTSRINEGSTFTIRLPLS
jgi:signal transduction histidine kinase